MTTAWTTCRLCGGQRVPFGYVGDVIGSVCLCRFDSPAVLNFGDELQRITAERDALRAENTDLRDVLYRNGFRRCDEPACNCGSWHHRFGLPERMAEIKDALADAGHPLTNDNGNLPLKALSGLVSERDALRAEVERLTNVFHQSGAMRVWAQLEKERDALRVENADLAAWQCIHRDGKTGLTHDENGNAACAKDTAINALRAEMERLRAACSRENDTISQTLGRALDYPRFADDQKNFPGATDADGVCVGDHVAASLADEAANTLRTLRSEVERMRDEAESLRDPVARPLAEWHEDMGPVLWWCMPVEEGPWVGQPTDSDWPGYHTHWTKCVGPSRAAQGEQV